MKIKNKKAQPAIEFLIFLGVALIILIVFSIINITYLNNSLKQRETTTAQDLVKLLKNEINLASRVEPGYIREVALPVKLDNKDYQLGTALREVYIIFVSDDDRVFSENLATTIEGIFSPVTINEDNNVLTIIKCEDESVIINEPGEIPDCD